MKETRPKKCGNCNLPTTLHVTKVVGGEVQKLGACSGCPHAASLQSSNAWDLIDPLTGGLQPKLPRKDDIACPGCGLTPADFKESGRLGCSQCYTTFEAKLGSVIAKLHSGDKHVGKFPKGKKRVISPEEIQALKRRLEEHVSREEYEMAAVVRDQINAIENEGSFG